MSWESSFRAFEERVREKDHGIAEGNSGMDDKMRKRMEALSRMTTQNGATSNEQQIAQRKMKAIKEAQLREESFASRVKSVSNPTQVKIHPVEESTNPYDANFRNQFEELKRANRKKWGIK